MSKKFIYDGEKKFIRKNILKYDRGNKFMFEADIKFNTLFIFFKLF
jgi:hypothetical protein